MNLKCLIKNFLPNISGIQSRRRPDGILRGAHTRGPPHRARARLREPLPGEEVLLHHPLMSCW